MQKINKYQSLLVIVVGLLILFIIFKSRYFLWAAVGVGTSSLIIPRLGDLIIFLWYKLAEVLGWINTRILLSIVFFLFLFPISVIYRLFNKDSLQLKKNNTSTFKERNHQYGKKDLENIW